MAPEEHPNFAIGILYGLSTRMRMALMDAFKFSLIAGKGVTVQIFLTSLYKASPSEVALFFSTTQPLEKLLQGISSIDLSVHEIAPARNPDDHFTGGIDSTIDPLLVALLTKTVNAASERKSPADVADFMNIVFNDAQTAAILRNDLGLILRGCPPNQE